MNVPTHVVDLLVARSGSGVFVASSRTVPADPASMEPDWKTGNLC